LPRWTQTVEAYHPNEYLPAIAMQFCQIVFDSHALDLQFVDNGLDYTAVVGEPPVSLHHVTYVCLKIGLRWLLEYYIANSAGWEERSN